MTVAALIVAVLALLFTAASFWWLNARRGNLEATRPRAFAFAGTGGQLRLRLPLAFYNTGAADLVVDDLRLVVGGGSTPLRWTTTRDRLRPEQDDGFRYPTPFAVHGRGTRELIVEFGEDPQSWRPGPGSSHVLRVEGQLHPKGEWVRLGEFTWWAPIDNLDRYIAHRNEPRP